MQFFWLTSHWYEFEIQRYKGVCISVTLCIAYNSNVKPIQKVTKLGNTVVLLSYWQNYFLQNASDKLNGRDLNRYNDKSRQWAIVLGVCTPNTKLVKITQLIYVLEITLDYGKLPTLRALYQGVVIFCYFTVITIQLHQFYFMCSESSYRKEALKNNCNYPKDIRLPAF